MSSRMNRTSAITSTRSLDAKESSDLQGCSTTKGAKPNRSSHRSPQGTQGLTSDARRRCNTCASDVSSYLHNTTDYHLKIPSRPSHGEKHVDHEIHRTRGAGSRFTQLGRSSDLHIFVSLYFLEQSSPSTFAYNTIISAMPNDTTSNAYMAERGNMQCNYTSPHPTILHNNLMTFPRPFYAPDSYNMHLPARVC